MLGHVAFSYYCARAITARNGAALGGRDYRHSLLSIVLMIME